MNKKILGTTLGVCMLACGLIYGVRTHAASSPEEQAKRTAVEYLNACETGNAQQVVRYVRDSRFADQKSTLAGYQQIVKNDRMRSYRILSLHAADDSHAVLSIEATTDLTGTHDFSLPMVKEGNKWFVQIDHVPKFPAKTKN